MAAAHNVISLDQPVLDCAFHPSKLLISIAMVDGCVESYVIRQAGEASIDGFIQADEGWRSEVHDDSCRCLCYSSDGSHIHSGSKDGQLAAIDSETGDEAFLSEDAHDGELSRIFAIDPNFVATGDDDGIVKLWDPRQYDALSTLDEHEDFITDFAYHRKNHCLVSTSGDGTIGVFDIRKNKLRARSESDADDEYCSVVIMKGGKKAVVGTQEGVLNLFSWGHFNDCSDRYPGHPHSIDALVKYDEDTLLTGAGDGAIRIISVLPNKLLGVLGTHELDEPVERMAMSCDRALLASISHDSDLKIWDLSCLQDDDEEEDEEPDGATDKQGGEGDEDSPPPKKKKKKEVSKKTKMQGRNSRRANAATDFFTDLL